MQNKTNLIWKLCCAAVVVLSVLCFTPLVIAVNQYQPQLLGLPFSLWTGMLIAFSILACAFIATLVHPDKENSKDTSQS